MHRPVNVHCSSSSGRDIHVQRTAFGDRSWKVCLRKVTEAGSLVGILSPPFHIFLKFPSVVTHPDTLIQAFLELTIELDGTQEMVCVFDISPLSNVQLFEFQVRPTCLSCRFEPMTYSLRTGLEK